MGVESKIDKLIEENETKYSDDDLRRAAGRDFIFTSNPKDNFLDAAMPIKGDAVKAADFEHRAKVLGMRPDELYNRFTINSPSGILNRVHTQVDAHKLSGYAAAKHPDKVGFFNTTGSLKRQLPLIAYAAPALGLAAYAGIDSVETVPEALGAGAVAAAPLTLASSYLEHLKGKEMYKKLHGR
jgi:hypothetical protein